MRPERNIDDLPSIERREALRAILQEAGLVTEKPKLPSGVRALTEEEREELGNRLVADPPLSQIIIEEREGR